MGDELRFEVFFVTENGVRTVAGTSLLAPSMGAIGDCYDNAVTESFWSRMQVELPYGRRWKARIDLANTVFDYLEIFRNRQRRHSALGILASIEYEARDDTAPAA